MNWRTATFGLALLLIGVVSTALAQPTITLNEAVRQGKVKVHVQQNRSRAAGANVRVEVEKLVSGELRVEVEVGTVLLNSESSEQNLAVGKLKGEFVSETRYRPGKVMVLVDNKKRSFLLEAFCLDYAKKAPKKGRGLSIAVLDKRASRILHPPKGLEPTLAAFQIALWMDRAGISGEEARKRFRGETTTVDVEVAQKLLVHAEQTGVATIPKDISADVRVEVGKLFSSDPAVRVKAAGILGKMGSEALPAIPFIAENLLDQSTDRPLPANVTKIDVNVAIDAAADVIGKLNIPDLGPLVELARERASERGVNGMKSKPGIKVPKIVGNILTDRALLGLKHKNVTIRIGAARTLGKAREKRGIKPLIEALADENAKVQAAAAEALKSITDQDFGMDAAKWTEWLKDNQ